MSESAAGSRDRVTTLSSRTFGPLVLDGGGRIAVEFMSYGCGYCRAIEPILQQVAKLVEGEETGYRVNIAAYPGLAQEYAISGTPTFVMFLNGREVGRAEGPSPSLSSVTEAVTGPFVQ